MKKILSILGAILGILLVIVLIKGTVSDSRQIIVDKKSQIKVDADLAAKHLSEAIKFKTVSYHDVKAFDKKAFKNLHDYLKKTYPASHAAMKKEVINEMSLLYSWKGSEPEKKPVMLMAHLDVVPVEKGTEKDWRYPAFSGKIAEKHIWGRGAMDIKNSAIAIMESVESLAKSGFKPKRTIYLAFGHDEEVGGMNGNKALAALLKKRGIRFSAVLDEGGSIVYNMIPGVKKPVALIGISEKGYLSLELTATDKGGHSSMPPKHTAVGKLAAAIKALEDDPFPGGISGPAEALFSYVSSEMPFGYRLLFNNMWLFKPLLEVVFSGMPSTSAMIRTTTAATMFEGSQKDNVLPQTAKATINFRIIPGESIKSTINRVRDVIDNPEIKITPLKFSSEPSPVSDPASKEFKVLQKTISTLFPEALVAPYLVLGGTDSRYYTGIADQVLRFCPTRILTKKDLSRMHGTNERISIENFAESVKFFVLYIQEMNEI